jgi:hypothetical protein
MSWEIYGAYCRAVAGWPRPTADDPDAVALTIHNVSCGVGGSHAVFEGSVHRRLAFFTTSIDEDSSALLYSIW